MQQLEVNIAIPIPADQVIISKVRLKELEEQELIGVYWSMNDLKKRINKSDKWIKENILYPTRFKKTLDSKNGGAVYYPESQGQSWSFQANKMAEFLDTYFPQIFS